MYTFMLVVSSHGESSLAKKWGEAQFCVVDAVHSVLSVMGCVFPVPDFMVLWPLVQSPEPN